MQHNDVSMMPYPCLHLHAPVTGAAGTATLQLLVHRLLQCQQIWPVVESLTEKSGLQGVTCGKLATVVLHTVDGFGNPGVCGGEDIAAQLHGGPSRGIPSTVKVLHCAYLLQGCAPVSGQACLTGLLSPSTSIDLLSHFSCAHFSCRTLPRQGRKPCASYGQMLQQQAYSVKEAHPCRRM